MVTQQAEFNENMRHRATTVDSDMGRLPLDYNDPFVKTSVICFVVVVVFTGGGDKVMQI